MLSGVVAWAALTALACTPAQYAAQADKAAYGLIREKQEVALGGEKGFQIAYRPFSCGRQNPRDKTDLLAGRAIPTGDEPVRTLSLKECLELALRNSRAFQTRKEELYCSALALANMRHDWSGVSGEVIADLTTTRTMHGQTTHSGSGETTLSFARKFADGGILTLAAGLDAATSFLGIKDTAFGSLLEANFTQPLLRGAWRGFAYEQVYRGERDFAYAILDYERFTQRFAVGIAADYYRTLQRRDELQNELDNLKRLRRQARFDTARAKAGIVSRVQADQSEQNALSAQARVETTRQRYRDTVDQFKMTLGLPIVASIELDKDELARLKVLAIPLDEARAIKVAMRTRPDVLTSYAEVRDAERDVEIAADQFNPRLDLAVGISAAGTEPRKPFRVQFHRHTRFAGVGFDYALDQTDNRDDYRRAIISLEKAGRDLEQFLDSVRLAVRQSYRALERSARTFKIQQRAVALAGRRTKMARLEQKEGVASIRDVLEAEDALRSGKNALTAALVSYATTRLDFLADLGMISVDGKGNIHERNEPFYFDRLRPEGR